ncbi:MBL fold metallo-hydrolase [Candidatus Microgenomates bacterium]|nr:MBL fold metallo-hydrolase [Candidatus Microgenomates bacterium]
MKIECFVLGQLQTNCYLVYDEISLEGVVIDPADEGDFLSQKILDLGIDLQAIIATHGHFDHVLSVLELKLNFNIPFLMHKADLSILSRMQDSAKFFTGFEADPPAEVDKFLKEDDIIKFGKAKLKVMETPGHTPGSICLFSKNILFSGDTLFCQGVGRTDFSYSSSEQLTSSIKNKLFTLPKETCVYSGHGESTTIAAEKLE